MPQSSYPPAQQSLPPAGDGGFVDFPPVEVVDEPSVAGPILDEPILAEPVVEANEAAAAIAVPEAGVLVAEEIVESVEIVPAVHPLLQLVRFIGSGVEWLIGGVSILLGLALLAPLPVLQLLSLGYLLEVSGRIARTGKFSAGFVGYRKAARVGTTVLGTFILLLPLRLVARIANDAAILQPGGGQARAWYAALWILAGAMTLHLISAYWRGGRLRHFFLPANPLRIFRRWRKGGAYAEARDAVWNFAVGLRLPYYFWLGARGFVGGLAWLIVPVSLLAFAGKGPFTGGGGVLMGLLGAGLLALVVLYLPFVQTRFAAENRFRALFEIGGVRQVFRRAPVAFWIALFFTLLFALPLYLLKIELVPRDAAGLPSLMFVAFILPARFLAGWACGRGMKRQQPRLWLFRWLSRFAMLPVAGFYVFFVFFTQYTSWHGLWSLYEQHAFLLPVPFLGM